jgi:hypothetical protein
VVLRRDTGAAGDQTVRVRTIGVEEEFMLVETFTRPCEDPVALADGLRDGRARADQQRAWFAAGAGVQGGTLDAVERTLA